MKILVLTKRHHMGQDAYAQLHGRYFAIPEILAERPDTQIQGLIADYHPDSPSAADAPNSKVAWHTVPVMSSHLPRLDRYWRAVRHALTQFRPDVVWAGGDALVSIIGQRLAASTHTPCVLDLKDNYEAYLLTRIPGVRRGLRSSIRNATATTCGSPSLLQYAESTGATNVHLLPMAADSSRFYPISQAHARNQLGIPTELYCIGTTGALTKDRNISTLPKAASLLRDRIPNLGLVVAGARDESWMPPQDIPVYDFGKLPVPEVNFVLNSLDAGVICNRPGTFGSYCYPQKYHEMRACQLPVAAAQTGIFEDPSSTPYATIPFTPDSPSSLANAIVEMRDASYDPRQIHADTWHTRANVLDQLLTRITAP